MAGRHDSESHIVALYMQPSPSFLPGSATAIDSYERRFRSIYPLLIYARYYKQVWLLLAILSAPLNLAVLGVVLFGRLLGSELGQKASLLAEIFFIIVVVAGLAVALVVLDYFTSEFGKIGGVIWIVIDFGILALFAINIEDLAYVRDVVETSIHGRPYLAVAAALIGAFAYLFVLHIVWVVIRGAWALLRITAPQRAVMRESRRGLSFVSRVLFRLWGLPPSFEFARRSRGRYAAIIATSLLSAAFLSAGSVVAPNLHFELGAFEEVDKNCQFRSIDVEQRAACIGERAWDLFEPAALLSAVVLVLLALGWNVQRLVQRLVRFSLEDLQRVDPRAPILFLRAFGDDQIALRPPRLPFFAWLVEFGNRRVNLDQMLLSEATSYGPVVGLGNPQDRRPPYGAARGYFDDKTWQEAVADLARASAVIVICLDDTDGIWWEVEYLAARQLLDKTLFLTHPRHQDLRANATLLHRVASSLSHDGATSDLLALALAPKPASVVGFFFANDGKVGVLHSSTFSRFAYFLALRLFLREKLGTMPRPL